MLDYLLPLAGYLLGSISSAVAVARLMGLADPRATGSRNPGATNVLRYGGKIAAACTLAGDVAKGLLAVALARMLGADPWVVALCGLFAFLGHLYPVFFRFHGGKGVATGLGVWLALAPPVGVLLVGTWLAVAALYRYSSLAAIAAAIAAPFYVLWLAPVVPYLVLSIAMSGLLLWRHRGNIQKLLGGTEARIGR